MNLPPFIKAINALGLVAAVKDALVAAVKAIVAAIQSSVVTKTELEASTTELRGEINELRRETKAMAAELRGEISSAVNKMLLAQLAIAGLLFAAAMDFGVGGFRIARHSPRHPNPRLRG